MTAKRGSLTTVGLVLLIVAVSWSARAEQPAARQYLPLDSVDVKALIDPPPAPGSLVLREQMAIVLWLQRTRTPSQIAFVQQPLDLDRFTPMLSLELLTVNGLELKRTLEEIIVEVRIAYDGIKSEFDLRRPFEDSYAVEPVAEARPVAAYPSGHAIRAIVYARILGELFPEQKEALVDLARQIGYGRVIGGVHYPIDILAGQKLGQAYADVIVQQPAFKKAVRRICRRQP